MPQFQHHQHHDQHQHQAHHNQQQQRRSVLDDLGEELTGIIAPVSICMALVVLLVQALNPDGNTDSSTVAIATIAYHEQDSDSAGTKLGGALLNALVFMAVIGGMTFVLFLLFKWGCYRVIHGYMAFAMFNVFFLLTGALVVQLLRLSGLHVDLVSLTLLLFNFSIGGIVSLFFLPVPLLLKQAYTVWVGICVAYIFTHVPEWTTWVLLLVMAVYDLAAVLLPGGPLKILVELAIERQQELPALIYESRPVGRPYQRGVWRRGGRQQQQQDGGGGGGGAAAAEEGVAADAAATAGSGAAGLGAAVLAPVVGAVAAVISRGRRTSSGGGGSGGAGGGSGSPSARMALLGSHRRSCDELSQELVHTPSSVASPAAAAGGWSPAGSRQPGGRPVAEGREAGVGEGAVVSSSSSSGAAAAEGTASQPGSSDWQLPGAPLAAAATGAGGSSSVRQPPPPPLLLHQGDASVVAAAADDEEDGGASGSGMSDDLDSSLDAIKLGLGDFIFYSMLVGRAAMYDMMTVFASYLAIIAGLVITLLMLAFARKALPALPVSIALGVLFYFATRLVVEPVLVPMALSLAYY